MSFLAHKMEYVGGFVELPIEMAPYKDDDYRLSGI